MVFLSPFQRRLAIAVLALMVWGLNFFLHFFWEMLQVPYFVGMAEASHFAVVWQCTEAALGDSNIALLAYVGASLSVRDPLWPGKAWPARAFGTWLLIGILITLVFEAWATEVGERWSYTEAMPRLPLLGTGILPLLQWLVIPAL